MRDYSKISSTFWTGETGRQLREFGPQVQLLAVYLLTSPHANRLGLYYCPLPFICHETGIPLEEASKGLRRVEEAGFAAYDADSEVVWVFEMAKWQSLKSDKQSMEPNDNQVKGINKDYQSLPKCSFLGAFFDRYENIFHLENRREDKPRKQPPKVRALEAPSKPLRSQEIEIEQEIEREREIEQEITTAHPDGCASTENESGRNRYELEFEILWPTYPKRSGSNPRARALKAYNARRRDGHEHKAIADGISRYAKFLGETGKLGSEYVMQAATFLGPDLHFLEPWDSPNGPGSGGSMYAGL